MLTDMINGRSVRLDERQQARLAMWCIKTGMMVDLTSTPTQVPEVAQKSLYRAVVPPDKFAVFTLATTAGIPFLHFFMSPLLPRTTEIGGPNVVGSVARAHGFDSGLYGFTWTLRIVHFVA